MKDQLEIHGRLRQYSMVRGKQEKVEMGTVGERIWQPFMESIKEYIHKVTPAHHYAQLDAHLRAAGNPMHMGAGEWILLQSSMLILEIVLILSMSITFSTPPMKAGITMICLGVGTVLVPKMILRQKIQERQEEIQKSLPDVLDLLTVSVEAGLGFDGAISKVVEKMPGVLSKEFSQVLKEIRVGVSKREALKKMIDRVPVPDLITFVGAVLQADQLGVSMGSVLRIQSKQMRQKRRQRAQEKAMKAPIKILFPMVFFIFPTIFIILLGPVVIKVIQIFNN